MENRNAHSLQRQNELEQQLMSRSAPNDAVLPEPRPPPAKPRTDLDALFALTKRFCCVQIGNCFILLIAVPASIYCMILSMGILIGFLGSIKFVEQKCAQKSEREKRDVFGRHWLLYFRFRARSDLLGAVSQGPQAEPHVVVAARQALVRAPSPLNFISLPFFVSSSAGGGAAPGAPWRGLEAVERCM